MYSVFIDTICLPNFHFTVEFFFAKRVNVPHMLLKHLIPVILLFFSILKARGYVRHNNVDQNTKIRFST